MSKVKSTKVGSNFEVGGSFLEEEIRFSYCKKY